MSDYWQRQMGGFNQAGRNITTGLQRAPMMRAMGAMNQARAGAYQAQAGEDAARTALLTGQLEHLRTGDAAVDTAAKATADYMRKMQLYNDTKTPEALKDLEDSTANMAGAMSSAQKNGNPAILTSALQKLAGMNKIAGGDLQGGANFQDPVAMAENANNNAQKAATPQIIPSGATQMTQTGQPLATGGVTLTPGQQRFAPQGNLTAGLAAAQPPDDGTDGILSDVEAGQPTAAGPAMIASVPPLPPKATPAKPNQPPLQSPAVLSQIFKQNLANSDGGTNTEQAVQATLNQTGGAPSPAATGPGAAKMPAVASQDDYDALPPGASYMGPDGRQYVKKGK